VDAIATGAGPVDRPVDAIGAGAGPVDRPAGVGAAEPYAVPPGGYGGPIPSPYQPGPPGVVPYGVAPMPYPAMYPRVETNGMAIAALVIGLVGAGLCFLLSPIAIPFGHVALGQIKRSEAWVAGPSGSPGAAGGQQGRGMAIAGLVLGYIGVAVWLFALLGAISDSS
jgi:hypothetical protein